MDDAQQPLEGGPFGIHPIVSKSDIQLVIADVARANGLESSIDRLYRQCETESSWNVAAYNKTSDCKGLFQLSAPTAKEFGVNRDDWRDNIVGGVKYMRWLLNYYKGDYAKALAGFNWGIGYLNKLIKTNPTDWRDHLPAETSKYLTKIL